MKFLFLLLFALIWIRSPPRAHAEPQTFPHGKPLPEGEWVYISTNDEIDGAKLSVGTILLKEGLEIEG